MYQTVQWYNPIAAKKGIWGSFGMGSRAGHRIWWTGYDSKIKQNDFFLYW
jgi:hypothetical protein